MTLYLGFTILAIAYVIIWVIIKHLEPARKISYKSIIGGVGIGWLVMMLVAWMIS